jgi:hypothetical protein
VWLAVIVAISALATAPVGVRAEERTCTGSLGAITVDNLRVPQDRTCTLNGTKVKGTIKVERNATLKATSINVVGNIQAEGAKLVNVAGTSRVGGSVQVVQGGGASVVTTAVNGDILYDDNASKLVARGNTVGGNIQVFQNTGGVEISKNRVKGNLQCKENNPRPTGGGNIVGGNKEDQSSRL